MFADAGYHGIVKRQDANPEITWHVATRALRQALHAEQRSAVDVLLEQAEKPKAGIRAKVEHPLRVIKHQFGLVKARYRGLKKKTRS